MQNKFRRTLIIVDRIKNRAPAALQVCTFTQGFDLFILKHIYRSQQSNSFVRYVIVRFKDKELHS
jgi:hypothetical protein